MTAWLAYVPVPGLAWIAALLGKYDRFVRYHARQGGVHVGLLWIGFLLLGVVSSLSEASVYRNIMGALTILWLLAGLGLCGWGIAGVLRSRYVRVRPAWDLLAAFGR